MKQVLIYIRTAYFISWIIWLPLYGNALGWTNLPGIPFNHALGALGPLLAALLVTALFAGKQGLRNLWPQLFRTGRIMNLLIALFAPFVLLLLAMLGDHFMNGTSFSLVQIWTSHEFPHFTFLQFFAYNLLFFGFGEETGWRGFVLPRLQMRYSALTAALLLTAIWALWHLPLFFYRPGYVGMNAAQIVGWIFSLLTGSVLLTWLYNSSRGSILVCAVFHSAIDVAFMVDTSGVNVMNILGMLITLWGIAMLLIFKPANLSRQPKFTGQTQ